MGSPNNSLASTHSSCLPPSNSMSLDSKILELRLLLKDSTITLPSITRVANKLQALGKAVNDNAVLESFLREVMAYQLEFEKSSNTFLALDRQKDEYTELESKIESDVTAVKASIQELEEELRQQQILRAHRIECEHLAADVNKLTSRSTLKRKIDAVNQTLDNTNASIELVEIEIKTKHAQFVDLASLIAEMQRQPESAVEEGKSGGMMDTDEGVDGAEEEEGSDSRSARNHNNAESEEAAQSREVEVDEDGNPIGDMGENEEDGENEGAEEGKESGEVAED